MSLLEKVILKRTTSEKPIWLMRQAGRYLPEFREIRKNNQNFIQLCLNKKLSSEITLQPLKRFDFDAAIIFSDILMIPFAIGQKVEFKKNLGPLLGELNLNEISNSNEKSFTQILKPVYQSINNVSKDSLLKNKSMIGFIGGPWTLMVYMLNRKSPKNELDANLFKDEKKINDLLTIIKTFSKIHIKNQVDAGASIIQIFDSWAGLIEEKDLDKYLYSTNEELVEYTKSLGVSVICFPRNIKDYKKFVSSVKPSAINIDYNVNPKDIVKDIDLPIQGGLDPKILLTDRENLKKEAKKYLEVFREHPYIFNLGHGVLPDTDPLMVKSLIDIVKDA